MKSDTAKSIHGMLETLSHDDMESIKKRLRAEDLTNLETALIQFKENVLAGKQGIVYKYQVGDAFVNNEGTYGLVTYIHVDHENSQVYYHGVYYHGKRHKTNPMQLTQHTGGLSSGDMVAITREDFDTYTRMVYKSAEQAEYKLANKRSNELSRANENVDSTVICKGCSNEVDLDTCHCGSDRADHGYGTGHAFVPMGCDCGRSKPNADELVLILEENEQDSDESML